MASSTMATFHLCASAQRSLDSFPSPKLAKLTSTISSFTKGASARVQKASGHLLERFVDLAFKFEDQPWLPSQENFRPVEEVGEEVIVTSIDGEIPEDFTEGVYIRNGSNPVFGALQSASSVFGQTSETWMEGEGMLHAITFSRNSAGGSWTVSYKNRYVESETYRLELLRNRPCFLPVLEGNGSSVIAAFLINKLRYGKAVKFLSNTSVFEHSGRVFSAAENHLPQEIDPSTLETIGNWDIDGAWDRSFIAHPKKTPDGELVFVGSEGKKPFLVLGVVSADGKVIKHNVDINLKRAIICHDIGITKNYNIILDMPLTINIQRLMNGGPLIKYEKESYARIGVMPRYGDTGSIKWFEVEPYCTLHLVNCYEYGDEVVIRGGRSLGSIIPGSTIRENKFQWSAKGFKSKSSEGSSNESFVTRIHEWRLNMKTGTVKERYLSGSDFPVELPMINDLYVGLYNQYAYAQIGDPEASFACAMPKYGGLAKFYLDEKDSSTLETKKPSAGYVKVEKHQLGANKFFSGAAFVSKRGDVREDDGWVISFVHDEDSNTSQAYIIDTKKFDGEPVAKITLPRRVPYGFHGAFIPKLG